MVYRSEGATSRDTSAAEADSQGRPTPDFLGKHLENFSPSARNRGWFVASDEAERFWSKVDVVGECWLWTGGATGDGYGRFVTRSGQEKRAHRYAWELLIGPIPEGHTVDHLIGPGEPCRSTLCVRAPDHLEPVTNAENLRRRHARRRTRTTTPGPVPTLVPERPETTAGPDRAGARDHRQPDRDRHGQGPVPGQRHGQRAGGTSGQGRPARTADSAVPAAASGTTDHAGPVPAQEVRPRRWRAEASDDQHPTPKGISSR